MVGIICLIPSSLDLESNPLALQLMEKLLAAVLSLRFFKCPFLSSEKKNWLKWSIASVLICSEEIWGACNALVYVGGQPGGKELCRNGPGDRPGGHRVEHEEAICPCCKEC